MKTKLLKLLGLFLITASISYGMDATMPMSNRTDAPIVGDETEAESEMQRFKDPDIQNIVTNAKQQWKMYQLSTVATGSQLGQVGSEYSTLKRKLGRVIGLARNADMIGMQGEMGGEDRMERRTKDNPYGRPAPVGGMQGQKANAMAKLNKANDDFLSAIQSAMNSSNATAPLKK